MYSQSTLAKPRQMSSQMRAVLAIFDSDPRLATAAFSAIDLRNESVDWPKIFKNLRSPDLRGAAEWAHAIWRDELPANGNPFDSALEHERKTRRAILEALAIRWGLSPADRDLH